MLEGPFYDKYVSESPFYFLKNICAIRMAQREYFLQNYLLLYDPICIPCTEGHRFINPGEIIYITTADDYCHIYCKNGVKYEYVSITCQRLYKKLPKRVFIKVHRCYLVSKFYMRTLNPQKTIIYCLDGLEVKVSRSGLTALSNRFEMG